MEFKNLINKQREFFFSGKTFSLDFRLNALKSLRAAILKYEKEIVEALKIDLGKSATESYMCEIGLTLNTLSYTQKNLSKWMKNKSVTTPIVQFHSKSFIVKEPYGVVLIMSPWNYPFLLTLEPLIAALSAGNCCVVKPSAYSQEISKILSKIISETFSAEYITVVEGGRSENNELLEQKFDYIFFTGSVDVGKQVMQKSAQHLTPVTLELGGKSPCIIDQTADLKLAARRIVFGKFLNCGQTCVAPDYVLIEKNIKDVFIQYLKQELILQYGENILENSDYGKIINKKHFDRILSLIDSQKIVFGGEKNEDKLQIYPTILDNVTPDDKIMQEEIFGPILPILSIDTIDDAYVFIKSLPKPLALYLFTNNKKIEKRFLKEVSFGGGCVNDTIIHLTSKNLPFGGVGNSGMGSYHGKKSFDTFTHEKSIIKKYNWIDLPMRYQPYNSIKEFLIRRFLK